MAPPAPSSPGPASLLPPRGTPPPSWDFPHQARDLRPAPPRPPSFVEGLRIPLLQPLPLLFPQNLYQRVRALGPRLRNRETCRVFGPLLPKSTRWCGKDRPPGWARVFYESIFLQIMSFDSLAPQKGRLLPSSATSSSPARRCCWQSHAVTSHPLPHRPPSRGLWVVWQEQTQGCPRCAGHRMLGAGRGEFPPTPTGQRHCPLPESETSQVQ